MREHWPIKSWSKNRSEIGSSVKRKPKISRFYMAWRLTNCPLFTLKSFELSGQLECARFYTALCGRNRDRIRAASLQTNKINQMASYSTWNIDSCTVPAVQYKFELGNLTVKIQPDKNACILFYVKINRIDKTEGELVFSSLSEIITSC